MNPDLLIIYLACGAPLGVYQITAGQPLRSRAVWFDIPAAFLFWPAVAAVLLFRRLTSGDKIHAARTEEFRGDIERLAFVDPTIARLFEFREAFYRYTGLVETAASNSGRRTVNEIFIVTGHSNQPLATRCLDRRNRTRLSYQTERARNDLINLISTLADRAGRRDELFSLTADLARHMQDEAAADISAIRSFQASPIATRCEQKPASSASAVT